MKKIIIILICFYGIYANAQPYMIDQIVGIVGSKPIKQSDVENLYSHLRMQGYPMRGDMKCLMFEELLTQNLLLNQAEVDSLTVEPSEVELRLNRNLDFYIQQAGSQERLEQHFNKSLIELREDLRSDLHDQILAEKMRHEITANVRITPSEVRSFYNRIPRDSIPLINGLAQVAQIVIYPPYSDEAISEVRQNLLEMRRRVIAGERFSMLARLYSECPSAEAIDAGALGFMSRGQLDPEFARVAWSLKDPGEVSRIVESKNGFHIIQLIEKRGDQVNVRHILMTPKPNPEAIVTATTRLDSIAQIIRTDKISWNDAAFFLSQDEKTRFNGGVMINPYTYSTRFEMDQFEPADFAVIQNLRVGEISAPYVSRDENNRPVYKIVKLVDRSDPRRASLRTDYNFLQELALEEKMDKVIREWVEEKIESSYIFIDPSFRRCELNNNWLRQ